MRGILFTCFLILIHPMVEAQEVLLEWKGAERVQHDILGNIYLIRGPEIRKYNSNGMELSSYSNPIGNRIEVFDPSISTTVLTYHRAFQELIILDNTLNTLYGPLYLIEFGLSDVTLIHSSDEQHVWMYERATNQLIRFNVVQKQMVWKGPNLDQVFQASGEPDLMIHTISGLFLRYPSEGIAQFDIYGNFLRFIPMLSENKMFVINGAIIWDTMGEIRSYTLKSLAEGSLRRCPEEIEDFSISGRYIYYLQDGKLFWDRL